VRDEEQDMAAGDSDVRSRVAVVTGAASGIGLALVEGFIGDGHRVVMADIDEARLGTEAARLRTAGGDVLDVVVDVGDATSVDALARRTVARYGRVDVLCNNAGTIAFGQAWELELAEWERVLRVNFLSVVHGIRSFVPVMRESGDDGRIVNTASMAAFMQLGAVSPYVATKHAVVGLSIALAEDLQGAGSGISVSVVCPGMVATRFGQPNAAIPDGDDLPDGIVSATAAADRIRVAIAERQFYVFTHDDSIETVQDRFNRTLTGFERSRG
jgi:NAD(P)-dependent dehydrogenase (short-subunit alcohol dehydrogenase family)